MRASAFASTVFPTPGTSSTRTWPSARRQSSGSRSVSRGACMTVASPATTRSARSAAATGEASAGAAERQAPSAALEQPLDLVEHGCRRSTGFGARATSRSPSAVISVTSLSRLSKPMSVSPHVVVDDEIDVLVGEHRALALEAVCAVLGAEGDEHLVGPPALPERTGDVGRRRELELPGGARPSGRLPSTGSAAR